MGRVLQDQCTAAMYTWNALHWEDGFSNFDLALFHNTFWTKKRAQAFGMGLLAAAGKDPIADEEDGELPNLTRSTFVPAELQAMACSSQHLTTSALRWRTTSL
jgi:hypothetical protein